MSTWGTRRAKGLKGNLEGGVQGEPQAGKERIKCKVGQGRAVIRGTYI